VSDTPSEPAYSFTLRSGRRVWLDAFHLSRTYAGLFVGHPKNQMGYIWDQQKKAIAMWADAVPTVPPATIIREHDGRNYES
jgi:hypothetical protein